MVSAATVPTFSAPDSLLRLFGVDDDAGAVRPDTRRRHRSRRRAVAVRDDRRRRRARTLILVFVLLSFALTRGRRRRISSDHPQAYGPNVADGTGDVNLYDYFTWEMRHTGQSAYADLHMEYPPGAIPVMMVPRYVRIVSYRTEFILLMIGFDALGLWGLARIARRGGTWWGFGAWMVLVPLLGMVSYTRFDMVVAVALVWAVERALAGKWKQVGALHRRRRRREVGSARARSARVVRGAARKAPRVPLRRDRRHRARAGTRSCSNSARSMSACGTTTPGRGVQAESIWGAGLLVARWFWSYPVAVVASHRAYDAQSAVSHSLKLLSNTVCLSVLGFCTFLAARTRRGDIGRLALLMFGTMTVLVGFGSVYSPQYLLWIIGLGSAALALRPRAAAPAIGVLVVTVALAYVEFPMWFWDLLFFDKGGALEVLAVRDVLTVVVGALALWGWRKSEASPAERLTVTRLLHDGDMEPEPRWRGESTVTTARCTAPTRVPTASSPSCAPVTKAGRRSSTSPRRGRCGCCTPAALRPHFAIEDVPVSPQRQEYCRSCKNCTWWGSRPTAEDSSSAFGRAPSQAATWSTSTMP